ncbi:MAG: hypothetical protein MRZ79_20305 [Bacteroidia bacterium]|nr:hypothetical protein [Bacteroidia bacterium]
MNLGSKVSLLLLSLAMLFAACQRENIDEIILQEQEYKPDTVKVNPILKRVGIFSSDSINIDCIRIPFPVDFLQASGNTVTVNSEAELDSVGMLADSIINFVYPFDAVDNTGPIQIDSLEDLLVAITTCGSAPVSCPDQDAHVLLFFNALNILTLNNYVYEINYPVSLIVEGTSVTINSDSQYLPAIGGSPFDYKETELVYPITITQFGRDIVLKSDADVCAFYETLDEPCTNKPAHIQFFFNEGGGVPVNCAYFINYPVSITSNGNTIQIQTRDDYLNQLNASPSAYNNIDLVYPVSITKFSGGQQPSFASGSDICQYLDNCR